MLKARGYTIQQDEEDMLHYTLDEFIRHSNEYLENNEDETIYNMFSRVYTNGQGKELLVYYTNPLKSKSKKPKVGVKDLTSIVSIIEKEGIKNVIVLAPFNYSSTFISGIEKLKSYDIQLFKYSELYINPTEHYLVGKHRILTRDEAINYLAKAKIKPSQLPKINDNDPVAKFYGAKPGDIIEIKREPVISGNLVEDYIYHRLVKSSAVLHLPE